MDEKKEKKKKKKKKGNTGKEIVNDGNTIDIDMKWLEQYQDRNLAAEYLKNTEPVDLAWYAVFNKAFCEQKTTPEHDRIEACCRKRMPSRFSLKGRVPLTAQSLRCCTKRWFL
jgi:hypothetical protein